MNLTTLILVILLAVLFVGVLPAWPYSAQWGRGPASLVAILVVVVVLLILTGRIG